MKKLFVYATAVALTAGWIGSPREAIAQQKDGAPKLSHQVGLIDMQEIFKNYKKLSTLQKAFQEEVKQTETKFKGRLDDMKTWQEKLQSGDFAEGSADYAKLEQKILTAQTGLETDRRVAQRDFMRKEADVYKTVYMEVETAVQKYAKAFKYTLVLRFNRQTVDGTDNVQELMQSINRQVVYYRGEDDITDQILKYINDEYTKTAGKDEGTAPARKTR